MNARTSQTNYIERLESIALNDADGHRCDTCDEVWDVDDMHEARLTPSSNSSICKRCAGMTMKQARPI